MSPVNNKDLTDTGKERVAIAEAAGEAGAEHVLERLHSTSDSSEEMRDLAEKVFKNNIKGHALDCMKPGGPLHSLGEKMDSLRRTVLLATGAILLVAAFLPFFFTAFMRRTQVLDDLQIQVARLSAQQVAVGNKL